MTDNPNTTKLLEVATTAAQAAGQIISQQYGTGSAVSYKDASNIVTETDEAAEQTILQTISQAFPEHAFFSEEAGSGGGAQSDYLWVIDPLDGTTNFSHQIGRFCTSIALRHNNEPLLGVVFDPINQELFTGIAGGGAYLNQQAIQPSDTTELAKVVLSLGRGDGEEALTKFRDSFAPLVKPVRTPRIIGSDALALCYIAAGRLDALVIHNEKYYDGAAGAIIAAEAGAIISDFQGQPWHPDPLGSDNLLATNSHLHQSFVDLLKNS